MHLDDISGEKYALYFHNLLSENVDDLPFISFYDDFSVSVLLVSYYSCIRAIE